MDLKHVLMDGSWQPSSEPAGTFRAKAPRTRQTLASEFPISNADEVWRVVRAAAKVSSELAAADPERIARCLEAIAANIEAAAAPLVEAAAAETGLPATPRLADVELPRTTGQLRKAAHAARHRTWQRIVIDTQANLRTRLEPVGPVVVFGPNNFPFAFNAAGGGDFAAAFAAGNPVIAKAHPSHPETTRLLAEATFEAVVAAGLPAESFQLLYHLPEHVGLELVAHPSIGATAFTGGRSSGLKLKAAAERVGKPIYLELSSINPVFILPGALRQRGAAIAEELATSCLLGAGQFCTNPGVSVVVGSAEASTFELELTRRFGAAPQGVLLGEGVVSGLQSSLQVLREAGAVVLSGGNAPQAGPLCHDNTLLRVSGDVFLEQAKALQTEAFGPAHLLVVARDWAQLLAIAAALEGNLTASIYTDTGTTDDAYYGQLAAIVTQKVGRLLNDKMPTGVAVSPAMHHGGPYPATGHAGFTSVGLPASVERFVARRCYDGVRPERLPAELLDACPDPALWRNVDGEWKRG